MFRKCLTIFVFCVNVSLHHGKVHDVKVVDDTVVVDNAVVGIGQAYLLVDGRGRGSRGG